MSDKEISDYCGFNENEDKNKEDNAKKAYKILMIVFICLTALLLATSIFLGIKLSKAKSPPSIDPNLSANMTQNGLQSH